MVHPPCASYLSFLRSLALVDPQLATENRLDPRGIRLVVELDGAEEIAVVGQGEGWKAMAPGSFQKLGQANGAVKDAVNGVDMEMDKVSLTHG
jgi:hypothetical protein